MKSIADSFGRSRAFAPVIAVAIALSSFFLLEGVGRTGACVSQAAVRAATPAIQADCVPVGRPANPAPLSAPCGLVDSVEDEVETGDPQSLRFIASWRPARRTGESVAGPGRRASVSALLARAADFGRLCRRLL